MSKNTNNLSISYSTIETKEVACIGYNGFLFRMSTPVKTEGTSFISRVIHVYLTCTIMMLFIIYKIK